MPFCTQCGRPVDAAARYCATCGHPLAVAVPPAPAPSARVLASAPCVLREGLFKSTPYQLVVADGRLVFLLLSPAERKEASRNPRTGYAGRAPLADAVTRPGSFALSSGDLTVAAFHPSAWVPSAEDVPPSRKPAYLGLWTATARYDFFFELDIDEAALASALAPFLR